MRKLIVIAAAISALRFAASAQQPTSQTLLCSGTYSMDNGQHSYPQGEMNIVVGNDSVTITGYSEVPITQVTQTKVDFSGQASTSILGLSTTSDVSGSIDLMTGHTNITASNGKSPLQKILNLTCTR